MRGRHGASVTRGFLKRARRERSAADPLPLAFLADEDKTDLSGWLTNGTPEKPDDLGYWVGYRIVKSYDQHAANRRRALREVLERTDPQALLARSSWYPGIQLR